MQSGISSKGELPQSPSEDVGLDGASRNVETIREKEDLAATSQKTGGEGSEESPADPGVTSELARIQYQLVSLQARIQGQSEILRRLTVIVLFCVIVLAAIVGKVFLDLL